MEWTTGMVDYWNGGLLEWWTNSKSLKTSRILPHFLFNDNDTKQLLHVNLYHACCWEWPDM